MELIPVVYVKACQAGHGGHLLGAVLRAAGALSRSCQGCAEPGLSVLFVSASVTPRRVRCDRPASALLEARGPSSAALVGV